MIARHTPLKRSTKLLKRSRVKWRSKKTEAADQKYTQAKKEHFLAHPTCQHPAGCTKSILKGDLMDLHHKAGRTGPLRYCKRYFATACRAHHNLAKDDPIGSRANGWLLDVSSEEVWKMRQREILTGSV